MSDRQRIKRTEKHFRGREGNYVFSEEEHSAFLEDGNIVSQEKSEKPLAQGIVPHEETDIRGQCKNCDAYLTKEMYDECGLCQHVTCRPCLVRNSNLSVCPDCSEKLDKHRKKLMFRKFFIDPFLEILK